MFQRHTNDILQLDTHPENTDLYNQLLHRLSIKLSTDTFLWSLKLQSASDCDHVGRNCLIVFDYMFILAGNCTADTSIFTYILKGHMQPKKHNYNAIITYSWHMVCIADYEKQITTLITQQFRFLLTGSRHIAQLSTITSLELLGFFYY